MEQSCKREEQQEESVQNHKPQAGDAPLSTYPLPEGPRMAVTALVGKLTCIFRRICLPDLVFTEETAQYPSWAASYPAESVMLVE